MNPVSNYVKGGLAALAMVAAPTYATAESATLAGVKERGTLLCSGHNGSYFGFVEVNDKNHDRTDEYPVCGNHLDRPGDLFRVPYRDGSRQ